MGFVVHRPAWQKDSACSGMDPEKFFPEDSINVSKEIKDLCHSCPVVEKCLEHALRHESVGFWGGMSARGRDSYRRTHRIRLRTPSGGRVVPQKKQPKLEAVEDLDDDWRNLSSVG